MTPGTLIADKYRIERVLGRGGMGVVVEASHLTLRTRVALKFLDASMISDATALARFTREARAAAQLTSEHICRVSDNGVHDGVPYIVMEMLTGTDLARLSKQRLLDVPTAALYVQQACVGLAEAHGAGIIHRDLKPGNLFLTRKPDGRPLIKILDFGVAKVPMTEADAKLTATAAVVGSQGFLAPEQFRASSHVDGRADVWSLGVILHKIVTGELPFPEHSFADYVLAITRAPTPPMPTLPPPFAAVISRCLEKQPEHRYRDVRELAEALQPFAAHARSSPIQPISRDDPDAQRYLDALVHPAAAARATPAGGSPVPGTPPRGTPHVPAVARTLIGSPTPQPPARLTPPPEPGEPPRGKPTAAETAMGTMAPIATAPTELVAGTVVGEYRIERMIGQGGMGAVYAAIHPVIGKKAAIKVIRPDLGHEPIAVERFVQEARSVNQIGHPNIVDVFAFARLSDGRNYFVMELLQGESLRDRLTRSFIPLAEGLQILDEIASALEAAHEKQVVHRDLKPDNVFLAMVRGSYILVKLLDFGIAKLAGERPGLRMTGTGELMGTPAYLSPEQARGRDVDHRTDIYALGCMMFEVVTGRMPFAADSAMDVVGMHVSTPPPRASTFVADLPPLLDNLIVQAMAKDPQVRPTIAEIRAVFAELVASGTVALEAASGVTFRSELSRARSSSAARTGSQTPVRPLAPVVAAMGTPVAGSPTVPEPRRSARSSEQPTSVHTPPRGSPVEVEPPSSASMSRELAAVRGSRTPLVVVVTLLLAAALGVIVLVVTKDHAGGTRDPESRARGVGSSNAPVAAVTPDASLAPADVAAPALAAVAVTADAAVVESYEVTFRLEVPDAALTVDGISVSIEAGIARHRLAPGPHHVVATASGRVPFETTVDVTSTTRNIDVALRPTRKTGTTATRASKPPTKPTKPTRPTKPKHPDDVLDVPF